jgi:hypothetical protein
MLFLDICIYSPHCPAGSLSRGDPRPDRTAEPGRPGTAAGLGWWSAGRRSACLGRARCLAARGGYVIPASRVPAGALAPPAAPSPRLDSRGTGKPRTLCAARTRRCGCLNPWIRNSRRSAFLTSPRSFAGRGRREAPGEGPGTALPIQKPIGSEEPQRNKPTRESSISFRALPRPSPEASLRSGFDLSPQRAGRG